MAAVNRTQPIGIALANLAHFRSVGRTGTGAVETIPHGLSSTPGYVSVQARDSSQSVVLGKTGAGTVVADHTNIYVNVASAQVYDLIAIMSGE